MEFELVINECHILLEAELQSPCDCTDGEWCSACDNYRLVIVGGSASVGQSDEYIDLSLQEAQAYFTANEDECWRQLEAGDDGMSPNSYYCRAEAGFCQ